MSPLTRAVALVASTVLATVLGAVVHAPPAGATIPRGDTVDSDPDPSWGWERVFVDGFDGPAGNGPDQWHAMPSSNWPAQNGQGLLDVGQLAQIRTNQSWVLPVGTQVRVTARLMMPNTGSNYAAFWVQHPNGTDPRELDVVESYGPLKTTGAQLGSHICYDEMVGTDSTACEVSGLPPELWPVGEYFPAGAKPWDAFWQYHATFTVGGDLVTFSANDDAGNQAYSMSLNPDLRRVPDGTVPFHLRLSNKDVQPDHVVPGGDRMSMLVDWVAMDVKYP